MTLATIANTASDVAGSTAREMPASSTGLRSVWNTCEAANGRKKTAIAR